MFVCKAPPRAQTFAPTLAELGFEFRDGVFVVKGSASKPFFNYFWSNDQQTNDRRKEAMHEAARTVVADVLEREHSITQIFVDGKGEINLTKTGEAHVTLLATEVSKLRYKRDVIVIIGESSSGGGTQDAGIWAYRQLMREGGVEHGTVAGMAKKLGVKRESARQEGVVKEEDWEDLIRSTEGLGFKDRDDGTPGFIILNPGQLLYSSMENKSMSSTTWDGRPRASPMDPPHLISEKHNKVPGHHTPREHITTAFNDIIPKLVDPKARLYILTMGDTAEPTITLLDTLWLDQAKPITTQINTVIMIDPLNIDTDEVHSLSFKSFMSLTGITYKQSVHTPYGKRLDHSIMGVGDINAKHSNIEEEIKRFEAQSGVYEGDGESDGDSIEAVAGDGDDHSKDGVAPKIEDEDDVLCQTFSAGDCGAITENVMPRVMPDVVRYLQDKMKNGRRFNGNY